VIECSSDSLASAVSCMQTLLLSCPNAQENQSEKLLGSEYLNTLGARLEEYERMLGDEFDWEWWERQVFTEHAKQEAICQYLQSFLEYPTVHSQA
jgi:hypothetical protein